MRDAPDFPILISPQHAQTLIETHTPRLNSEIIDLNAALGRTLAQDIVAPFSLPPFDNSAMDGYAVRVADWQNAPFSLRLQGVTAAGDSQSAEIAAGFCQKIMTGAPLPMGADAVVMREETREASGVVRFENVPTHGENIRRAGHDIARGETALRAGEIVGAAQWALLAALGQEYIEVARSPRVGIIVTGDELVQVGQTLRDGQIYDSNSYTLRGLVQASGGVVVACVRCGDTTESFRSALETLALDCDAIVCSGGVSAGDFDPVRDVLPQLARVHFWKLQIKPGKPVMFATLNRPNRDGSAVPIWGLPGNPVSVGVTGELLLRPALLQMQGRRARKRVKCAVQMQESGRSSAGKTDYQRAYVWVDAKGIWRATLSGEQGSGRLTTLTRANALLEIGPDVTAWSAGDTLPALMTSWPEVD